MTVELKQFSKVSRYKKRLVLKEIVMKALENYDLNCRKVRFYAEHSNILFLVEASNNRRYLMKIARPFDHTLEETKAYLTWLHQLHQLVTLPALKPVKTIQSEFVVTIPVPHTSEVRYCALFNWLPGDNLTHRLSISNSFRWGELLAVIHNCSEQLDSDSKIPLMRWNKVFYWDEEVLFSRTYFHLMKGKRRKIYKQTVEMIENAIQNLHQGSYNPIIIHADLHPDNIKVYKRKLYALDFEDAMWGYPVQDIAIALLYIRWRKNYLKLRQAFYNGYTSMRRWPEQYPGEIETFFMGRLIMFANFLVKTDDTEDPDRMLGRYQMEFEDFLNKWVCL